jgi:hypothetical protein
MSAVAWPGELRNVITIVETSGAVVHMSLTGGRGYAKVMGNPEGPHMLACEWIGTACAHWLGLPTFDVAIMDLSHADAKTIGVLTKDATALAGPAFLAKEEPGGPWGGTADELRLLENPNALAGMIVLDTWLRNHDRNSPSGDRRNVRNVFLTEREASPGRFRVLAMDLGHGIRCTDAELRANVSRIDNTKDTRVYGAFPEFVMCVPPEWIEPWLTKLGTFRKADAEPMVAGVPQAWSVSGETRAAVMKFMCQRADFLAEKMMDLYRTVYDKWKLQGAKP